MHKDNFFTNYSIKGFPLYVFRQTILGKSFNEVISEKIIFVHLLVNANQLYNDARWIQRESHLHFLLIVEHIYIYIYIYIKGVSGGIVNIVGGGSTDYSE
jgi:hypothetical protein